MYNKTSLPGKIKIKIILLYEYKETKYSKLDRLV